MVAIRSGTTAREVAVAGTAARIPASPQPALVPPNHNPGRFSYLLDGDHVRRSSIAVGKSEARRALRDHPLTLRVGKLLQAVSKLYLR